MKKICALCVGMLLSLLIPLHAMAETQYIIPDSNTRQLTREELWEWDYESLGYILNEIFARHGYNFIPGEKYDIFFQNRPWYTPNEDSDNQRACYSQLNAIEWYNEGLVKTVRTEMREAKNYNTDGKSIWNIDFASTVAFSGFQYVTLDAGQRLAVYSAPSETAWRGANGKAVVSTNSAVYAAGWDSGWLLVMYEINNGGMRVGYVNGSDLRGSAPDLGILRFSYQDAVISQRCTLTDDPVRTSAAITTLMPGDEVSYLMSYSNEQAWAYVETVVDGQPARGFIPLENCSMIPAK